MGAWERSEDCLYWQSLYFPHTFFLVEQLLHVGFLDATALHAAANKVEDSLEEEEAEGNTATSVATGILLYVRWCLLDLILYLLPYVDVIN